MLLQSGDLVGDAVWIAYKCILLLSESLETMDAENSIPDTLLLVEGSFAPCLAAFQHFMKRFPGSTTIVSQTLSGYVYLANAVIPYAESSERIQRKTALLTSLCKLSIPFWGGSNDLTVQMEEHHVACLEALFGVVHRHHNALQNDWYVVLCTLEYLSSFSVSSKALSDVWLKRSSMISSCLTRLSPFTTCLSDDSLKCFVDALVDVSKSRLVDGSRPGLPMRGRGGALSAGDDATVSLEDEDGGRKQTEGSGMTGRFLSFAGRAFGGGSDHDLKGSKDSFDASMARIQMSKTYAEDFCRAAYSRLAAKKLKSGKELLRDLSFSLVALTDVAVCNSFRYSVYGPAIAAHLGEVALSSASSEVRLFAMDTLTNIVRAQLSHDASDGRNKESESSGGPHSIRLHAASLQDYLCVDDVLPDEQARNRDKLLQADLLAPLCDTIKASEQIDIAEAGLNALYSILEGSGHNLSGDAWLPLINAIGGLSGYQQIGSSNSNGNASVDRSLPPWSTCSMLGFRCLKLIVDDFLDELPSPPQPSAVETRSALLDCCAAFGQSQHDVNTSLTATGMLWTIADQDLTADSLDHVLSMLALLSFDSRVEVCNERVFLMCVFMCRPLSISLPCSCSCRFACLLSLVHWP